MEALPAKARSHLKGLGHHLKPVVLVGKEGLSPALLAAVKSALVDHELIKVKLGENAVGGRAELSAALAAATDSHLIGLLGLTLLLFRRHPKKPKIELPESKSTRPGKDKKDLAARSGKQRAAKKRSKQKSRRKRAPVERSARPRANATKPAFGED